MTTSRAAALIFWLKGWSWLLYRPKFLLLVMAPWALGLILVFPLFLYVIPFLPNWADTIVNYTSSYIHFGEGSFIAMSLVWILIFLLFFFLAAAGVLLFYSLYILLCVPFYSILVESVLKFEGKFHPAPMTFGIWLSLTLKLLRVSFFKAVLFGFIGLLSFGISFVPGFNLAVPIVAAIIFAFDSMDYSFEAMGLSLRERFRYFSRNRGQLLLMSLSMGLTLLVPGLTFLALPGAVVGAALVVDAKGQI